MKTWNDLVYAVAKRAKELGDMKLPELREASGYGCDTPAEARRVHAHESRGELIELNLVEEFIRESHLDISFVEE